MKSNKNKYTYYEAQKKAQEMGIKTSKEYKERYKEDPRLILNVSRAYSSEWTGWKEFLMTGVKPYLSFAEASKSAINIGILNRADYKRKKHKDPRLPLKPDQKYKNEWKGWANFLGNDPVEYYKSLSEASKSVFNLGIRSQIQYFKRYKEDPKLPSHPSKFYKNEWVNWYSFLCKEKFVYYESIEEASKAAILLGIKTGRDYHKLRKLDPLLHCSPHVYYGDSWLSWQSFLKTEIERYETLRQASKAALKLGIKTAKEYQKRYKLDKLLPSDPALIYRCEWTGFSDFLNSYQKYPTIQEASNAASKLGIKNRAEYRKRYKEDSMLCMSPENKYKRDWIDWYSFLKIEKPMSMNEGWLSAKKAFSKNVSQMSTLDYSLNKFYIDYFKSEKPPEVPSQVLHKDYDFNVIRYRSFIYGLLNYQQQRYHNMISSFFDFILEEYCTDQTDDGDSFILPGFRNPLKTILKEFGGGLTRYRPDESVKPALPFVYIEKAKSFMFPDMNSNFSDFKHLHDMFTADWFDVSLNCIDKLDPDCVWRVKIHKGKEVYQMWCPARAIALFTLLSVPLRGQQILWLDSGEADKSIPVFDNTGNITWVENANTIAGQKKKSFGFIKRYPDGLGMFVTTNKTSLEKPTYSIPYIPHDLAVIIIKLRIWQSKYNPLKSLTGWDEIKLPRKQNIKMLKAREKQAFLFRDPCSDKVSPYRTANAFYHYLPKVLYEIQNNDFPLVNRHGKNKLKTEYTPHSMRVSLITAYVVDGGVPLQVVSKLVGHASIVMTIYYTKVSSGEIRRELGEAEKRALAKSAQQLEDTILDRNIEQARSELIGRDQVFFQRVDDSWPITAYQFSDKGICPMGGGACDSGGVGEDGKPDNSPTPAGYLGRRNCIKCRYFVTGPAFVGGLQALANEISLEIQVVNDEHIVCQERMQQLEDEQYDCEISGEPFTKKSELSKAHSDHEERATKLDVLLCDMSSLVTLIKQCMALLNEYDIGNGKQLIVSESFAKVDFELQESKTNFRLLSHICENASIYSGASASRALPLRSQMLDQLVDKNGLSPAMFRLNKEQQLSIGNQLTKLLMDRVESWSDIDRLMTGEIQLNDLSGAETLEPLSQSIKCLLDQSRQSALLGDT
ncbi:VPA1269 family protein [Thaumasiovibrio sp. DFM-14]|uniref:gamma-mobile-trio integrase GmtZ n=1 Tax=Thaumasiovibrio sp. DFM-14 TaxID=3384792 RepID=UPI0039A0C7F7